MGNRLPGPPRRHEDLGTGKGGLGQLQRERGSPHGRATHEKAVATQAGNMAKPSRVWGNRSSLVTLSAETGGGKPEEWPPVPSPSKLLRLGPQEEDRGPEARKPNVGRSNRTPGMTEEVSLVGVRSRQGATAGAEGCGHRWVGALCCVTETMCSGSTSSTDQAEQRREGHQPSPSWTQLTGIPCLVHNVSGGLRVRTGRSRSASSLGQTTELARLQSHRAPAARY